MPERHRHCKHCGLVVVQTKQPGDAEPLWYHLIEYVNPNRAPGYFRQCRITFLAEPEPESLDLETSTTRSTSS